MAGGAFGDDGTDAGCKVWGDFVPPESLPWGVVYEASESYSYMSRGPAGVPYLADGQIGMDIYADDRQRARDLGVAVAYALADSEAVLRPDEGRVTMIRVTRASFAPVSDVAPESGAIFRRSLVIQYQQQRMIGNG